MQRTIDNFLRLTSHSIGALTLSLGQMVLEKPQYSPALRIAFTMELTTTRDLKKM